VIENGGQFKKLSLGNGKKEILWSKKKT